MSFTLTGLTFTAAIRGTFVAVAVVLLQPPSSAQTPPALPVPSLKAAASASKPAPVVDSKPSWAELNVQQQQSLKPLAPSWNGINESQKRKWLEISKNYPNLPVADQVTMHSRMNEWVSLSPQQRAVARLNFAKTKELAGQLTPDEKKAKWETYQALSPEEKASLAAKASPKPAGAATAVKPVPAQKLAAPPKNAPPAEPK